MTQSGDEPRRPVLHTFGLCHFGLHTQVPCANRRSTWSKDPRTSSQAGAWRSANTALLSDCCPSLSPVPSFGFRSPSVHACRCFDHNFLNGVRVGEASHPGPQLLTGPRQEEQQVTPHFVAYLVGFDMGRHTQVPCSDRGSFWSKDRSKSPTEARTGRSACSDFSVACRSSSSPTLAFDLCRSGLHTQVPCINRGSTWSEDPRTSPPVAGAWRSADTALLGDRHPSLSSVSSFGFSSPSGSACRCLDHCFLHGMRVGEASHPGPQPMTGPRQEGPQPCGIHRWL